MILEVYLSKRIAEKPPENLLLSSLKDPNEKITCWHCDSKICPLTNKDNTNFLMVFLVTETQLDVPSGSLKLSIDS